LLYDTQYAGEAVSPQGWWVTGMDKADIDKLKTQ
jgi:hypothetical protein